MKKVYLPPVASLLMSLSLALGILVSDLRGYRLLTSAHAQEGGPCGGQGDDAPVVSDRVNIEDGLILSGITVNNVNVNGSVLAQAVIAGSVHISDATVVSPTGITYKKGEVGAGAGGVIVGVDSPCPSGVIVGVDGPAPNGVIVGVDSPAPNGVIVGVDSPAPNGVIVGVDGPAPNGVIVGVDGPILSGVTGFANGRAVGGTLTGDNITVTDGVITGQNLLLSGATFNNGLISGTIKSVRIKPAH